MSMLQFARGLWGKFDPSKNPFTQPNGMEENLRLLDDHIGLYTLFVPQPLGTAKPVSPADGDGVIYVDGSYAVFNGGTWKTYAHRPGVKAIMADGSDVWLSAEAGGWLSMRMHAALDVALLPGKVFATTAAGMAAVNDGDYFTVPSAVSTEFVILYRRQGAVATEIKRYPTAEAMYAARDTAIEKAGIAVENAGIATDAAAATQALRDAFVAVYGGIGYQPPVAYAAGLNMATATQTVEYGGETYAPLLSALPFATSGTFEAAKFRLIQGVSSIDLAQASGAQRVGRGAGTVDTALTAVEARATAVEARATAVEAQGAKLTASIPYRRAAAPAFIEQHLSGFFGRGMLTSEAINLVTEQALTGSYAQGAVTLGVTSATNFIVGGCVTIKHDNGRYGTYFVSSKASNNIGIYPALRHACTAAGSRIERTWYNRAHPGKFYMRELAQRIARSSELDAAMPNGNRVLYTNVSSNPNTLEDTLVAIGGAVINYYPASNIGESSTVASPVRFALGRSAYVDNITANSAGIETQYFDVRDVADATVKVALLVNATTTQFSIQVFDELDFERGKYNLPPGGSSAVLQIHTFPVDLRNAKRIKVRVACEIYASSGSYFVVDQIDVFQAPEAAGKIIANPGAKIVVLGDSWVAGDLVNTPEREPITTQLALELPYATIINAGVGGNKVTELLNRFATDVTPHAPDYVVVNSGTNECYSPLSGTFEPTAIDEFINTYRRLINNIIAIGARPIIIGVPALAQSDTDVPAFPEWQLNDRAKAYARYVFERQGRKPVVMSGSNANGSWTKHADGTMVCRHTVSLTTTAANTIVNTSWTYPMPFIAAPKADASVSSYATNQLLSAGTNGPTASATQVCLVSGSSGTTMQVDCIAVGRYL